MFSNRGIAFNDDGKVQPMLDIQNEKQNFLVDFAIGVVHIAWLNNSHHETPDSKRSLKEASQSADLLKGNSSYRYVGDNFYEVLKGIKDEESPISTVLTCQLDCGDENINLQKENGNFSS